MQVAASDGVINLLMFRFMANSRNAMVGEYYVLRSHHPAGNLYPRSLLVPGHSFAGITALGNCLLQCGREIVDQRGIFASEGFHIFAAHRQHNAMVHSR